MADVRIKVAKDKDQLLKALLATEDSTSPFQTYADVLVFAAALGFIQRQRERINEFSKEIAPIRQDIFSGKGYGQVINLLALVDMNDPQLLADNEQNEQFRIKVFEEYANSGLDIIKQKCQGFPNYTIQLLEILREQEYNNVESSTEFNLSKFIDI